MRIGEVRVSEMRVGEMGVGGMRVGEMRVGEIRVGEMRQSLHIMLQLFKLGKEDRHPRFDVTVEHLSSLSFTWAKIAQLLGILRMTLYRKRLEYWHAAVRNKNW